MERTSLLIFFLAIVGHLIGDFSLQTYKMATKKAFLNRYMLSHSLLVSLTTVIPFLIAVSTIKVLLLYSIVVVSHIIADNVKKFLVDLMKNQKLFWVILSFDQIYHVSIIYLLIILFCS